MKVEWYCTTKEHQWIRQDFIDEKPVKNILELSEEDQKIDGFGGCFNEVGYYSLKELDEDKKDEIFRNLFSKDGCNFSFCRLPIGANDYALEWYDYCNKEYDYNMESFSIEHDEKYIIPYVKKALNVNPDIKFFASPWSPPIWMKFPKAYNHGTMINDPKIWKAYAIYFARYVEEYKKIGVNISQIHVQNEPVSDQKFPSCIWTGEEFIEFIKNYLGPVFEEKNIDSEIWLGTLNGPETDHRKLYTRYDDYANLVLSDDDAYKYIKGVSYQWAGRYALQQTRESWPELKYIQSESECGSGDNSWEYARYIFELTTFYLRNGVSSYVYWNMILPPGGASTWGWKQNSMITVDNNIVSYNYEYYLMKHYSHFIENGAVRYKTKGHMTSNSVIVKNPDGSYIVVIGNPFNYDRKVTIKIEGLDVTVNLKSDSINTIKINL